MARQLTELEDQLDHMERAARGQIDALIQPFTDLAAEPVGLVRDGLAWSSDFAGTADDVTGAVRDFGSGRLVHPALAHGPRHGRPGRRGRHPGSLPEPPAAGGDARGRRLPALPRGRRTAGRARLRDARRGGRARGHRRERAGSFADLTANGNLSATALQQASVAAALSRGRINAAMSQVLAYQAVQEANRRRQAELARLEQLAEWHESRQRAGAMAETMRDAATLNRDDLRDGLLFQVPSFYGGN